MNSQATPQPNSLGSASGENREQLSCEDPRYSVAMAEWSRLNGGVGEASTVQVLKDDSESLVIRLCRVGPGGSNVIAKQADRQRLARQFDIERRVIPSRYRKLDAISERQVAPLCYGLVRTDSGDWLFEEDVGGVKLQKKHPGHTGPLSRLVASIHRDFAWQAIEGLPKAGPERHRVHLESALDSLRSAVDMRGLSAARTSRLRWLLETLEGTRLRWDRVADACSRMPETFVHGDLQPKNVRIVGSGPNTSAVVLDWERAGWGVPAIDLASRCVDLGEYASIARERWVGLSLASLLEWRRVGRLFRHLFWIQWALRHIEDTLALDAWSFLEDTSYDSIVDS